MDEVHGHERLEGEEGGGAGDRGGHEARERPPGVCREGRVARGGPAGCPRSIGTSPEVPEPREQQDADGQTGKCEQRRGPQTEGGHERRHERGPEREARVAAHREVAHATTAVPPGDEPRVPRPLGMERRDPQAAQHQHGHEQRVRLHQPGRADADAPDRDAGRQQHGTPEPVGPQAEQRLHQRGADRRRGDERRRRGEAQPALGDQERQQRGNGALAQIHAPVPRGQHRDAAGVQPSVGRRDGDRTHAVLPGPGSPSTTRSTTRRRASAAGHRCPTRMCR